MFSSDYGFIVDYIAELMKELRKEDHTNDFREYFELSNNLTSRDRDGVVKTFSGFIKILYPNGIYSKEEAREILELAMESRKRIKDQLIRMDETYEEVEFYYIDKQNGKKIYVDTLENENYGYSNKKQKEENTEETAPIIKEAQTHEPKAGQIIIKDNQTGISYKKLFGDYMKGATEITLIDPYIRMPYQFSFFLEFCVMLSKLKEEEEEINLNLITNNDEEHIKQSEESLYELSIVLEQIGINLNYVFQEKHDRSITTNNGWKIILGRGLDIFEKPEGRFDIGTIDQERRMCKACEITFLKL
jgi:ATP-dependent Lon protease